MSRSCRECVHHNPDFIDKVCVHCNWPDFAREPSNFKPKLITNADRIRAMSNRELAKVLHDAGCYWDSEDYWFEWLEQEVEESK